MSETDYAELNREADKRLNDAIDNFNALANRIADERNEFTKATGEGK